MDSVIEFVLGALNLSKDQRALLVKSGWVTIVSVHILWICGWLVYIGIAAPYVGSGQFSMFASSINDDRIDRIDNEIPTLVDRICDMSTNPTDKISYRRKLQTLISKYNKLAGHDPHVPSCTGG
jgi:hypothetical protein